MAAGSKSLGFVAVRRRSARALRRPRRTRRRRTDVRRPKRSANSARTAGTKAVPPVRNTRSIAPADSPASARAASIVCPSRAKSGAIQRSKSARCDNLVDRQPLMGEAQRDRLGPRQRRLRIGHGAIQRIALLVLDQAAQRVQPVRMLGRPADILEVAHEARRAHHREPVPAREGGIPLGRHGEAVAPRLILRTLAEQRGDDVVHDAGVERVTGDTDAGAAQRYKTARRLPGLKRRMEKSLVPPPKVADQDDGFGVERTGEPIAGALRLQRGVDSG